MFLLSFCKCLFFVLYCSWIKNVWLWNCNRCNIWKVDRLTICFFVETGVFCDNVQTGTFGCKNKCRIMNNRVNCNSNKILCKGFQSNRHGSKHLLPSSCILSKSLFFCQKGICLGLEQRCNGCCMLWGWLCCHLICNISCLRLVTNRMPNCVGVNRYDCWKCIGRIHLVLNKFHIISQNSDILFHSCLGPVKFAEFHLIELWIIVKILSDLLRMFPSCKLFDICITARTATAKQFCSTSTVVILRFCIAFFVFFVWRFHFSRSW